MVRCARVFFFWLKNKKLSVFSLRMFRLNSHIVLSYSYLEVARESLDGATEQRPVHGQDKWIP